MVCIAIFFCTAHNVLVDWVAYVTPSVYVVHSTHRWEVDTALLMYDIGKYIASAASSTPLQQVFYWQLTV